jgi:hypothetical protein
MKNLKSAKKTVIYYYILGKYCFNALQVIQLFYTNMCKIWPTVLVKGFCKLAAQLVSENSKLHELIRKRSSYTILTVFNYFILSLNLISFISIGYMVIYTENLTSHCAVRHIPHNTVLHTQQQLHTIQKWYYNLHALRTSSCGAVTTLYQFC